ncbi:MAG: AAA family ATPase [Bacilli bacterium]|nr:AAA family ATPase [Bacilli bacterium]
MYLSFFGMEFNPFDKSIDTKHAFETEDFKIVKNRLEFLKDNKGLALITGVSGVGKTFSIRAFLSSLNPNLFKVIYIPMSTLTVMEFYRQICLEPLNSRLRTEYITF